MTMRLTLYAFPEKKKIKSILLWQDAYNPKNDFIITKTIFYQWNEKTRMFSFREKSFYQLLVYLLLNKNPKLPTPAA